MFGAVLRHIANWTPKGIQVRAYEKGVCKAKESEATHNWNSLKLCKNSSNLMQRFFARPKFRAVRELVALVAV